MNINETRQNNIYNLNDLSRYLYCDSKELVGYYEELIQDSKLLSGINNCIENVVAEFGFTKGIFGKGSVDSIDWFAYQRVLIYVLIRYLKPKHLLETGVYYGGNTVFLLAAVHKNQYGTVHSIDLPDIKIRKRSVKGDNIDNLARHAFVGDSELYDEALEPGFIVPDYLKGKWKYLEGSSIEVIPTLNYEFGFYIHDSDHSFHFLNKELAVSMDKMSKDAVIVVDDLNWSNSFFKFCVEKQLYPLLSTDNGKSNLLVRTGLVKLDHPNNRLIDVTGAK